MKLLLNSHFTFSDRQRRDLAALGSGLEIVERGTEPVDRLDGQGVDILVTEHVPRNLAAWPALKWVQLLSAGANQILGHPIRETAIPVTTASGTHGVPIAQFVTGTWLMLVHRLPQLLEFKPSRTWPDRLALAGVPLRGLTAGIIGYGSIGRECARQLSALGMRIVCLKRNPASHLDTGFNAWPGTGDPEGAIPEAWYAPEQLHAMLPRCDLIVVTAPSTPETEGMMGKEEFALVKKSARMIIVSRGGIVEEQALAEALRESRLAAAVVDCFVREPVPPDHFFFDVPNLIMTPHMSGVYDGFRAVLVSLLVENIRRFSNGLPLLNQVDQRHGY